MYVYILYILKREGGREEDKKNGTGAYIYRASSAGKEE